MYGSKDVQQPKIFSYTKYHAFRAYQHNVIELANVISISKLKCTMPDINIMLNNMYLLIFPNI